MKPAQSKEVLPAGLYRRGGVIWMRSQSATNPFRASCETDDVDVALAKLSARLAEPAKPRPVRRRRPVDPMAAEPVTMRELFVLDYKRGELDGNAEGTLAGMAYGYKQLIRLVPKREVAHPTMEALRRYVTARRAEGVGNNTIRKELVLWRCGLNEARAAGRHVTPIGKLPKLSLIDTKPGQSGTYRTVAQLQDWLAQLQPEARAVALLYVLTGVRFEEGRRLTHKHLRLEAGPHGQVGYLELPAPITKPKKMRRVVLTELGLLAFRLAVPIHRLHRSAFRGAAERAGVQPYIHARDLRTAFASIGSGLGDPYTLHLAMGHGRTTASTYQRQDMDRLASLASHVQTRLGLTTAWLARAHLCHWAYLRGSRPAWLERLAEALDASQVC